MKNANLEHDIVFHTLQQAWEGAVSIGLRSLADDDLLRLLTEVDRHTDDADDVIDEAFADAPDWDDMTPAELDAVACRLERLAAGGTSSAATPVVAPLRKRQKSAPSGLRFEELESRFSPSTFTVISHGRACLAPVSSARWNVAEHRTAPPAWQAEATAPAMAQPDDVDHVLFDFDSEALGHMALAQVA
jgi:hypothetical protein